MASGGELHQNPVVDPERWLAAGGQVVPLARIGALPSLPESRHTGTAHAWRHSMTPSPEPRTRSAVH